MCFKGYTAHYGIQNKKELMWWYAVKWHNSYQHKMYVQELILYKVCNLKDETAVRSSYLYNETNWSNGARKRIYVIGLTNSGIICIIWLIARTSVTKMH